MGQHVMNEFGERIRRNTLSDILHRTRMRFPNKIALIDGDQQCTYAELDDSVQRVAQVLQHDGVQTGQMFAVLSKNNLDFVIINFALARIGAVMVPINYMLVPSEIAYILTHADVCGLFATPEFASRFDEAVSLSHATIQHLYLIDASQDLLLPDLLENWVILQQQVEQIDVTPFVEASISNQNLAQVLYTSGTESRPKGVMLSHENLLSQYVSCIVDGHMESVDVFIHALPMYHSAQLHCFLGPSVYLGATGIILPNAAPSLLLETIERYQATQLFCPPTVWIGLLRHPAFATTDKSSLRKCYYGAAIMPQEVLRELASRLPNAQFWNFYGQTEVAPLATALQPEDQIRKLGSAGRPVLHVETKIVDEEGLEVSNGDVGEIVHRTPHAMLGYLKNPEKTDEAFSDGWFHSGDLGYMDDEGYLTVVDRKKDMIKTGGVNVSSREVEEVLYQHPAVSEVAVIGVPDDYWIEAVAAVIVCRPLQSLEGEDLIQFCKPMLSNFKIPKYIFFCDELPKNPSGKILKRELRLTYQASGRSS